MNPTAAFFFTALCLLCGGTCSTLLDENDLREEGFLVKKSDGGAEPEFYDSSAAGSERLSIEMVETENEGMEEEEAEKDKEGEEMRKAMPTEVDEETIRKAEKMADKDLLNGLNRILKNNETLTDVLKAENVYPIS